MQVFHKLQSLVIPLDMNNVDTDMIIPAQYLTKISREGYGQYLFQRLKEQDHQFIFNDPCYQHAEILITKKNFGCGSSREHAVWALMQAGIKAIIAESYSDIFYNNASKNGLLIISLSPDVVQNIMLEKNVLIDLPNQIITTSTGEIISFEYDSFLKECFIKGQDEFDYLLEATA